MPTTTTITRRELVGYVEETFEKLGLVERDTILNALHYKGAPKEEGVGMTEMRPLRHYLRDVSVDRSQP